MYVEIHLGQNTVDLLTSAHYNNVIIDFNK